MKKIIGLLLAVSLICGCSDIQNNNTQNNSQNTETAQGNKTLLYTNAAYDFSFEYPESMVVLGESVNNIVLGYSEYPGENIDIIGNLYPDGTVDRKQYLIDSFYQTISSFEEKAVAGTFTHQDSMDADNGYFSTVIKFTALNGDHSDWTVKFTLYAKGEYIYYIRAAMHSGNDMMSSTYQYILKNFKEHNNI
ncbi:MAG: hypothetical protein IJ736_00265 [Firmicutes bacterium]|nr:hypothetical protein [Bacillota bacterium]